MVTKVNSTVLNTNFTALNSTQLGGLPAINYAQVAGTAFTGNISAPWFLGNIQTPVNITTSGNITAGGVVKTNSTLNATNTYTAALVVAGGVGIGKDLRVGGNIYAGNLIYQNITTVSATDPLLLLSASTPYPYNYDIGFYSHFTGGPAGVDRYTGLVRNDSNSTWYLFSNIAAPVAGQVAVTDPGAIYDPLVTGNLTIYGGLTTTTAIPISSGGTGATTSSQALTNLLPSAGQAFGYVLATTASGSFYWANISASGGGVSTTFETINKNLSSYPYVVNYSGSLVANIVYNTGSSTIVKSFNYQGSTLSNIVIKGASLSYTYTKTLSYSGLNISGASYSTV